MAAKILDGRALASELRTTLATRAAALRSRGITPLLAIVIAGEDASSEAHVRGIAGAGEKAGVQVRVERLGARIGEDDARALLRALGDDPLVHGIIVQQPLPSHLGIRRLAEAIVPHKDVDGANPLSFGRLAFGGDTAAFVPATAEACMLLLDRSERAALSGVRACVVGRSSVVGLPVALLLLARNATVTIAHSRTREIARHTREAEVLIAAAGVPGLIRAEMVAPGATVIDVGTTYVGGTVRGDVAFEEVAQIAGEITPVPGGVGPLTNVVLLQNVVAAADVLELPS